MTDEPTKDQTKRDRSPSFPYIGLSRALERIQILHEKARRNEVRVADVAKDWGLAAKSSSTDRNVAALLAFGLVDDSGSGETRKIKLSDIGSRILNDKRPGVREKLLVETALKPKLIYEYHSTHWKEGRPDDGHAISHLTFDGGFTDEGARMFLRVFDDTIRYLDSDPPSAEAASEGEVKQSADLAREPQGLSPPNLSGLPFLRQPERTTVQGLREQKFALKEGDVVITFPEIMSSDSIDDLDAYLQIFLKKARREAGVPVK
jgi:hypothetical protein